MKRKSIIFFILSMIISLLGFSQQKDMMLDFDIKILNSGQYINTKGQIYYDIVGKKMTTHFSSPKEVYILTDIYGNYKYYESDDNSVMMKESKNFSSNKSIFYYFFNGKTQSLGYDEKGFELVKSEFSDNMLITKWSPKNEESFISEAEIVFENNLPIFAADYNKEKPISKRYYNNYQLIYGYPIPLNITEIKYDDSNDSTITEKKYYNIQKGVDANNKIKNFEVPSDAKIIK
jgi:hypothetical protein